MGDAFDIYPIIFGIIIIGFMVAFGVRMYYFYTDPHPIKQVQSSVTNTVVINGMNCQIYTVGEEQLKYISCPNNCSTTVENRPRVISADPVIYDDHKESVSSCSPVSK